ncbi:MAG: cyclopropane-fatty-acyl-phospholipid synthase family protein [Rhodospirillaceae bacterium]
MANPNNEHSIFKDSGHALVGKVIEVLSKITIGTMDLTLPDGSQHRLGPGGAPETVMVINRWRAVRRLLTQGDMGFVESYLDGDWDSPDPSKVVEIAVINRPSAKTNDLQGFWHRVFNRVAHMRRPNTKRGAKRNIAAHYDLGNDFYQQWLDPTMTYSSAYYITDDQPLDQAQTEKYRRIGEMLNLQPDHNVLEVGFGWGGFAEFAAKEYGCRITGLTLSQEQLKFASERMQRAGLADKVDLRLQDYRDVDGQFDRIASIEMFEAVGEANWPNYFGMIRNRLTHGGEAALQIITIDDAFYQRYRSGADFIQRYIFPGGMLPSVKALTDEIHRAKLNLADSTTFGDSYAVTLKEWRQRFLAAWSSIEPMGFDDRFRRMWEMYLAYCEGGFRAKSIDVGQFKVVRT